MVPFPAAEVDTPGVGHPPLLPPLRQGERTGKRGGVTSSRSSFPPPFPFPFSPDRRKDWRGKTKVEPDAFSSFHRRTEPEVKGPCGEKRTRSLSFLPPLFFLPPPLWHAVTSGDGRDGGQGEGSSPFRSAAKKS